MGHTAASAAQVGGPYIEMSIEAEFTSDGTDTRNGVS